jgi:hypothetical protein
LQPLVEIQVLVALARGGALALVLERLDAAAQGADLLAQELELGGDLEQALVAHHPLDGADPAVELIELEQHRVFLGRQGATGADRAGGQHRHGQQ